MCKKICLENIEIFIRLTGKNEILLRVEIAVVLSVNDRVVIRELVVFCALRKEEKNRKSREMLESLVRKVSHLTKLMIFMVIGSLTDI